MKLNVGCRRTIRKSRAPLLLSLALLFQLGCGSNENAHTTATTFVPPPPRQVLTVVPLPSTGLVDVTTPADPYIDVDPNKPLLISSRPNGMTFRLGEVVPVSFAVRNAKLRSEGGDFRIRYITDDDDPQWLDSAQPFGLSGWITGKHTIRLELIGPDGWPYRNGNQNVITREITVQ